MSTLLMFLTSIFFIAFAITLALKIRLNKKYHPISIDFHSLVDSLPNHMPHLEVDDVENKRQNRTSGIGGIIDNHKHPVEVSKQLTLGAKKGVFRFVYPVVGKAAEYRLSVQASGTAQPSHGEANEQPYRAITGPSTGPSLRMDRRRPVSLRLETWKDKLGKQLFINREIAIGDADFDRRVYIDTTAPERIVKALLSSAQLRQQILGLLEWGWTEIELAGDADSISCIQYSPKSEASAHMVSDSFQVLCEVSTLVPRVMVTSDRPVQKLTTLMGIGLLTASIALFFLTFVVSMIWEPLTDSALWIPAGLGIVVWLVTIPLLTLLLRGRSESLKLVSLAVPAMLFGWPMLVISVLVAFNGAGDSSPAKPYKAKVLAIWETTSTTTDSKSHTTRTTHSYHIQISPWRPGEDVLSREVTAHQYRLLGSIPPKQRSVSLIVHEGALGWPWLSSVKVNRPPSS